MRWTDGFPPPKSYKSKNVSGDFISLSKPPKIIQIPCVVAEIFEIFDFDFFKILICETTFSMRWTEGIPPPKSHKSKNVSGEFISLSNPPKIIQIPCVVPEIFETFDFDFFEFFICETKFSMRWTELTPHPNRTNRKTSRGNPFLFPKHQKLLE